MYSDRMIQRREDQILRRSPKLRQIYPSGIPRPSPSTTRALTQQIIRVMDDQGKLRRALTPDEEAFIGVARLRVCFDALFFLEGFVQIDQEGHGIRPLFPLWQSQQMLLDRLAALEEQRIDADHPDGLLFNILKARQLGFSTLSEALVAHRILTAPYVRALVGADVEDQAGYLFRMIDRIYEHYPWFLQIPRTGFNKDREMLFGNHSSVKTAWGKSTRGALQDTGGVKGHIGRGKTPSVVHISELSTWEHPEQLDDALLPSIPVSPQTLVLFESTAKGAGNWWHQQWLATAEGSGRFQNLFVPWGVEPDKYSTPVPVGWMPRESTLTEARRAEAEWPRWTGHRVVLEREQLYWYETTRAYYEKKGQLAQFKEEYATSPEDCFLYSGRSIFSIEQLEVIDKQARGILDIWACKPSREIVALQRDLPVPLGQPPAVLVRPQLPGQETFPVPPGYGFQRLGAAALRDLKDLRSGVLTIFEYPRSRGSRSYVMPVDVGDGIGLDYSVIDIIRVGTVEEPPEQVAQFVSNQLSPVEIARVADAIGRLYTDIDGIEALAAVECNIGPGMVTQNELQLHLGYTNFYVWEVLDARSPDNRYTTKIGWATSQRTRPVILSALYEVLTTLDPFTGMLDFRLNSPITRGELRHLRIPPVAGARLGDAEAAPGQTDDAVLTAAIGQFVAHLKAGGEQESTSEKRHRRNQLLAARTAPIVVDYRNSDATSHEQDQGVCDDLSSEAPDVGYFDERAHE